MLSRPSPRIPALQVTLLLRDPYLCKDINEMHCNSRYLKVRGTCEEGLEAWAWVENSGGEAA